MGYIPLNRNEQLFQYGNRFVDRSQGILHPPPVIKGKFHGLLSEEKKQDPNQHSQANRLQRRKQKVFQNITGKGHYIDKTV